MSFTYAVKEQTTMSGGIIDDRGFKPHTGHNIDSSYDTSTGWFQKEDSRVI